MSGYPEGGEARSRLTTTQATNLGPNLNCMGHTTQLRGMASTLRMRTAISPSSGSHGQLCKLGIFNLG